MDILTPEKLKKLKEDVKNFVSSLEQQNLKNMDIDKQYDCVLSQVEECNWSCAAIKTQCRGDKSFLATLIDVYEIYINIGYGCYICIYLDEELIDLPTIGWSDLSRLGQNSFIGTHLDYYAQANHFEIIKRENG